MNLLFLKYNSQHTGDNMSRNSLVYLHNILNTLMNLQVIENYYSDGLYTHGDVFTEDALPSDVKYVGCWIDVTCYLASGQHFTSSTQITFK